MKASLRQKLTMLTERHQQLSQWLSEPGVTNNQQRFRDLSREYAQLGPVVDCFARYHAAEETKQDAEIMLKDSDHEIRMMAQKELDEAKETLKALEDELRIYLLPKDPHDSSNVFLEIRAGTGGDEASIFSGDLLRMYLRYTELKRWQAEIVSQTESEQGGYKEVIVRIMGEGAYSQLKFESGAHRVQRVPVTESQGRVHTSACTIAVLPEVDEVDAIEINPVDLRVDTFRASGAGGQHVNRTDSAVRITHLPSGVVVECQDERSQHKNRARAMSLLQSRLLAAERERQQSEQAAKRRKLVGSGDRSERIRTYNYPQGRITDHRINLTLYKLAEVMEGALDQVIQPLIQEHQAELLAEYDGDGN